jgi:tRNA uracil 4-sulfurtransferase
MPVKSMKLLALISGGFDSIVAAKIMKDNNAELAAVHFSLEPVTDNSPEIKAQKLCQLIGIKPLYVVTAGEIFAEIVNNCSHRYYFVLSKRLMMRIAERIAKTEKCDYLLTGESLGQVSSQTLKHLLLIQKAVDIEILRPLLCCDKIEIIRKAEEIGSFEISKGPEVCDLLGPKNPVTRAKEDVILKEEAGLNISNLIENALKTLRITKKY